MHNKFLLLLLLLLLLHSSKRNRTHAFTGVGVASAQVDNESRLSRLIVASGHGTAERRRRRQFVEFQPQAVGGFARFVALFHHGLVLSAVVPRRPASDACTVHDVRLLSSQRQLQLHQQSCAFAELVESPQAKDIYRRTFKTVFVVV